GCASSNVSSRNCDADRATAEQRRAVGTYWGRWARAAPSHSLGGSGAEAHLAEIQVERAAAAAPGAGELQLEAEQLRGVDGRYRDAARARRFTSPPSPGLPADQQLGPPEQC